MTVPIPPGLFTNNSYFWANNSFTLGSMSKPVNARTLVTVDYSQLTPALALPIQAYWFIVDIGSNPALTISTPNANGAVLTFIVSDGVPGVSYQLKVNSTWEDGTIREDFLYLNIPGEGCCGDGPVPVPFPGAPISLNNISGFLTGEGTVFMNTGVRFFVSAVAPQSANILDVWFNSLSQVVSLFITNGGTPFWMPYNKVPVQMTQTIFMESLTCTAPNTLTPLTFTPDGAFLELTVNGVAFFPLGLTPPFHLSGNSIVWTSVEFSINPGNDVKVVYTH